MNPHERASGPARQDPSIEAGAIERIDPARDPRSLRRADAEARRAAQTVYDGPVILEAGAGTGKTTALVGRIVGWIMNRGWERGRTRAQQHNPSATSEDIARAVLDGVVAITFTEAAAAEMETGVGKVLRAIALDETPSHILPDNLPPERTERLLRAEALLGNLDRLQAHTIHGWCSRILNRFPLEAGLHPLLTVDADGSLRREIAEEVVEEYLHSGYTRQIDPALLRLARDGKGPGDLAQALVLLVEKGVDPPDLHDPLSRKRLEEFREELIELFDRIDPSIAAALHTISRRGNAQVFADWVEKVRNRLTEHRFTSVDELETFLEEVREEGLDGAERRLKEWAKGTFNGGERKALDEKQMRVLTRNAPGLLMMISRFRELRPRALVDACSILRPLLAEIQGRLHARGVLGYEDLLRHTRDLLHKRKGVRRLLRREIDQLLVDEFQDTNQLQCDIIALLARQGDESERPGLFLVGDPKQSIYGWRGADLAAYDRFVRQIEKSNGPRWRLSVNFRSVPSILHEVARIVDPVMEERPQLQPLFEPLLPSPENQSAKGYWTEDHRPVEHWISRPRSQRRQAAEEDPLDPGTGAKTVELESERLAADLLALQREGGELFRWSDIGLLFRSTSDLESYLVQLRRAGIPYEVEHDRLYFQRREIIDATALAACVIEPEDQLSLLTWLRSPWVGVPDAALLGLWWRRFPYDLSRLRGVDSDRLARLHAAVDEVAREIPADAPGIERIEGWEKNLHLALEQLAALRESFLHDPSTVFVRKLQRWTLGDAREALRYLGPYRAANVQRFFRRLRDALADPHLDPRTVVRRLRRGIEENTEEQEARLHDGSRDAVRVMTIHRAKGLDFRHVYLLQTHKESRGGGGRGPAQTEVIRGPFGLQFRLLGYPTLDLAPAHLAAGRVEDHERVRLLYVALTRAKQRLVIVGGRDLPPPAGPADAEGKSDGTTGGKNPGTTGGKSSGKDGRPDRKRSFDPSSATSFSRLLEHGHAGRPEAPLMEWADQARKEGRSSFIESIGDEEILWRFLAVEDPSIPAPAAARAATAAEALRRAREDAAILARSRSQAARRRQRPFQQGASAGPHSSPTEGRGSMTDPSAAMLAGSAIHEALQYYNPSQPREAEWDATVRRAEQALRRLAFAVEETTEEEARAAMEQTLQRMQNGHLIEGLRELEGHLLGREVGLLTSPLGDDDEMPVAFHPGSIDLIYRDPSTREIVVADFKTDRVTPEELPKRAQAYRHQGEVYCKAVQEALGLSSVPRFELWFLQADRIEVVR